MTDSVNPASPIMTNGDSSCACARKAERCAEDKVKILMITSDVDIWILRAACVIVIVVNTSA